MDWLEGLWGRNEDSHNGQTRTLVQEEKYSMSYGAQEKIKAGLSAPGQVKDQFDK